MYEEGRLREREPLAAWRGEAEGSLLGLVFFYIDQEKFLIYNGMVYTGISHFISLCPITLLSFIFGN